MWYASTRQPWHDTLAASWVVVWNVNVSVSGALSAHSPQLAEQLVAHFAHSTTGEFHGTRLAVARMRARHSLVLDALRVALETLGGRHLATAIITNTTTSSSESRGARWR